MVYNMQYIGYKLGIIRWRLILNFITFCEVLNWLWRQMGDLSPSRLPVVLPLVAQSRWTQLSTRTQSYQLVIGRRFRPVTNISINQSSYSLSFCQYGSSVLFHKPTWWRWNSNISLLSACQHHFVSWIFHCCRTIKSKKTRYTLYFCYWQECLVLRIFITECFLR